MSFLELFYDLVFVVPDRAAGPHPGRRRQLALLALLSAVWLEAFRRHARHGISIADGV